MDYKTIAGDMVVRDRQDEERKIAPLKPSDGAIIIDSTNMSVFGGSRENDSCNQGCTPLEVKDCKWLLKQVF